MSRNTLLIVDDMEINRVILRTLFKEEYNLLEAENGEQALMLLEQYKDSIAALLLDVVMPIKDGYEVMVSMKKSGLMEKIPVIIITSETSIENEMKAFDLGASDIIMKPFEPHVVKRRVQNAVELNHHREQLEDLVERQAAKLRESTDVLMDALSSVIEHRSVESGQHVLRIRMFTKVLLENIMRSYPEYDLNERVIKVIASAAALHDIGKISIPDAILNKPGALTKEEFQIMKTHSEKGCEILAKLDRMDDKEYLRYAHDICRYHHERWDGRGYPDGLKGDNIPVCAQAVGIADAYDALTTDRVYKKAFSHEKAYNMILNGECGSFSPKLLECFKSVREQFALLSHSYADGHSTNADSEKLAIEPHVHMTREMDTQQYGQLKYTAMMRYADATVMEVNLGTGIYHLVYTIDENFESLRFGENFEEAIKNFADHAVYEKDREIVYGSINHYVQDFVENGMLKRTRRYRVLHRTTGEYVWYEATILRIDINVPHSDRILIVWKEAEKNGGQELSEARGSDNLTDMQNLLVGIQQCACDRWFTIKSVNRGFINLFGYSRDEIRDVFHDRYAEMIYPDDRQVTVKKLQEQFSQGNTAELEYRVKAKDGRVVWVLDKCRQATGEDGAENLNCVLMDITQVKQAQEELRLTMERHQIIMDQTNDIIFEWDIVRDTLSYSSNWADKFGYKAISEHISKQIPMVSHILPEDIPKFVNMIKNVRNGSPYQEAELRIASAQSKYIWCRIRATTQFNRNGVPIKAVGVILDIDSEKRLTQELMEKAERDSLTKLYNKSAARGKIQELLMNRDRSEQFAMLIIDMDNFKQVNDTRGHMFGDVVLTKITSHLQRLFRSEDIIARIGGDEFLVFVRFVSDMEVIRQRAEKVLETFRKVLLGELDNPLSCSIGIACCPGDGIDYQDLFQACDQALYRAKLQGKNRYAFYDDGTATNAFGMNPNQVLAAITRIESDDQLDLGTYSIIQQTFKVLYETSDVESAIQSILEMIGRKYDVSRVYIFEESADGTYCHNTFEWCNEGIKPEIDSLQHVCYSDYLEGSYSENFNENGVFYCPDITVLPGKLCAMLSDQGILSLLQCAIREKGRFIGYVGFDDCLEKRIWTQPQIDALSFVSELLSTFLLKKRAQDSTVVTAQNLQMVLDNQNSWIYVIDPDTYELEYINEKTHKIAPEAKLGMRCFDAFFNRDTPCRECPAYNIRECVNRTMEVYNPVLKVWSLADASFIRWGTQDACLLSCHDITPYMSRKGGDADEGKA